MSMNEDQIICPVCGADTGPAQPQLKSAVFKCPECGAWIDSKGRHIEDIFKHFKEKREGRRRKGAAKLKGSGGYRGRNKPWNPPARKGVKNATE